MVEKVGQLAAILTEVGLTPKRPEAEAEDILNGAEEAQSGCKEAMEHVQPDQEGLSAVRLLEATAD